MRGYVPDCRAQKETALTPSRWDPMTADWQPAPAPGRSGFYSARASRLRRRLAPDLLKPRAPAPPTHRDKARWEQQAHLVDPPTAGREPVLASRCSASGNSSAVAPQAELLALDLEIGTTPKSDKPDAIGTTVETDRSGPDRRALDMSLRFRRSQDRLRRIGRAGTGSNRSTGAVAGRVACHGACLPRTPHIPDMESPKMSP